MSLTTSLGLALCLLASLGYANPLLNERIYQGVVFSPAVASGRLASPAIEAIKIDPANGLVHYGLVSLELIPCDAPGWYCLSDGLIEFAMAEHWDEDQTTWRYREVIYSVIDIVEDQTGLGSPRRFYIAAQSLPATVQRPPIVYIYSKARGLEGIIKHVAVGESGELQAVTYLGF